MIFKNTYEKNYTVLPNTLIEDERLNLCQLGLMTYLLSRPETWEVRTSHLAALWQCDIKTIRKYITDLISIGYIQRHKKSTGQYVYNVYPEPKTQKTDLGYPKPKISLLPKTQKTDPPKTQKTVPIVSKDIVNKDIKKKNTKKESKKVAKAPRYKFLDVHMLLAETIEVKIKKINANFKAENKKSWANDIRLIMERDGRSLDEICEVFDWANSHDFWRKNILSPYKLRKQWNTLTTQMAADKPKKEKYWWDTKSAIGGEDMDPNTPPT